MTTTENGDVLHLNGENDVKIDPVENDPTESQTLLDTPSEENIAAPHTNDTLNKHADEKDKTSGSNGRPISETHEAPNTNDPQICEKHETNLLTTAFGSITTIKSCDKTKSINSRTILWYLTFFGFIINYLFRININIAIVGMVAQRKSINQSAVHAVCAAIPMLNTTFNHTDVATIRPILEQVNEFRQSYIAVRVHYTLF